jgi:hypothetical protein
MASTAIRIRLRQGSDVTRIRRGDGRLRPDTGSNETPVRHGCVGARHGEALIVAPGRQGSDVPPAHQGDGGLPLRGRDRRRIDERPAGDWRALERDQASSLTGRT